MTTPPNIELRPSRLRVAILAAMHAATAVSFSLSSLPPAVPAALLALLALSLYRAVRQGACGPRQLALSRDAAFAFELPDGGRREAHVTAATVCTARVVWLVWRPEESSGAGGAFLLLPDQMSPDGWRRLQVWLRLHAAAALAGRGNGGSR